MAIHVSQQTEARLNEEARRQGVTVETLIERLVNEPTGRSSAPQTVFEQGLGLFSSPEDAALIDEVVALAYAERRSPRKEQPLAL